MKENFQYVSPMGWVLLILVAIWVVSRLPDMVPLVKGLWGITKWLATVIAVALSVGLLLALVALPVLWFLP